jgi:hypothetical protein
MKKSKTKYFVSCYEEYPIYEPAEGGYYYSGRALSWYSHPITSLKKARQKLRAFAKQEGFEKQCGKNQFIIENKHVGEGVILRIETVLGAHESGRKIYC